MSRDPVLAGHRDFVLELHHGSQERCHLYSRTKYPYQPVPLLLLNRHAPRHSWASDRAVSRPLHHRPELLYAHEASSFVTKTAAAGKPFMLYLPFNHVHVPNSCGTG